MQKTHPSYTRYNITVSGKVINNKTGEKLTPIKNIYGYLVVTLYDDVLPTKQFRIHRLVYETFVGPIEPNMQIDHIDGNKLHNHLKNLEMVTPVENSQRFHRAKGNLNFSDVKKDLGTSSKLTLAEVMAMILDLRNGMSNTDAGNKYKVHPRYVSLIRHKRRWGYAWRELGLESATTNPSGSRA